MTNIDQAVIKAGTEKRLVLIFTFLTAVVIAILLIVLPYKFYERDVNQARKTAKEISHVLRAGILSTMTSTGESEEIRKLITIYQDNYDFQYRLIRSAYVEKQHGIDEDMQAKDDLIREVLQNGKGREDWLSSTSYRYITPYVADQRCQECHEDLEGESVKAGMILGASEIIFDLTSVKSRSVRFIVETVVLIVTCFLVLGATLFFVVQKSLISPLKENN
ncbi:MAG: hypothetical protein GY786_14130 [Proteobacteria bacterium]|nr:hypothetical protein [Pseudomonadota bacterium]